MTFCVSSLIIRLSYWCVNSGLGTGLLLIFVTFLPITECSLTDKLKLTPELESIQKKKRKKKKEKRQKKTKKKKQEEVDLKKRNEVSSLILRLSN